MLQSGAGRVIVDLAVDCREKGFETTVVSSGTLSELTDWPSLVSELKDSDIAYHELNLFKRDPQTFWSSVTRLMKIIEKGGIDLIHAHAGVPAAAAHSAMDMLGVKIPVVTTFYSWGTGRPEWMNIADLHAFHRSTVITVGSSYYRDYLLNHGIPPEKIELIPWGIDKSLLDVKGDRKALLSLCPGASDDDRFILILAVIEPRKNQEAVIRALPLLPDDKTNHLVCIGTKKDVEYYEQLMKLSGELGVEDRVTFTGYIENPAPLVAAADVFAFPSLSEGLGIAIIEAMALGVPVAGHPVEGAADLIKDDDTALAFNPDDPSEIAEAIGRICSVNGLADTLVRNSRSFIEKNYLWKTSVDRTTDIYNAVITSR
jgi:glycosyltransferase involved in cell wall biosynthesis